MQYDPDMDKMDKIALEILKEFKVDGGETKEDKKAYYANFPKELYDKFEKAVEPATPTKAFTVFMMKIVQLSGKKKVN